MKLLSEEWAAALTTALNEDDGFRGAAQGRSDVIAYRVSTPGEDEVVYSLSLNDGEASVKLGEPERKADLTIQLDRETALKMSQGGLKGQQASMTGRVKLDVPLEAMISFGPLLDTRQVVEMQLPVEA